MENQQKRGCLICGKKTALNRGLCSTHHSRYYKEVRDMTAEQKAVYDAALIDGGYLLPIQKRGPKVTDNPFARIAGELFAAEEKQKYRTQSGRSQPTQESGPKKAAKQKRKAKKKNS